mmetsp:Transcript_21967/g.34120  ORF Transcript_21967/g.34120 Transcript_21967/m.34120 type:complete len:447 (+) Transcript_21967:84-1424(+)
MSPFSLIRVTSPRGSGGGGGGSATTSKSKGRQGGHSGAPRGSGTVAAAPRRLPPSLAAAAARGSSVSNMVSQALAIKSDNSNPLQRSLAASHPTLTSSGPDRDEGVLQSLPLGANGLSLGLCGLAGVCGELERRGVSPSLTTVPYWVAMGCAALLFVACTARLIVSPRARLRMEATTPQLCFAYGAYQMTYLFVVVRVVKLPCPACIVPGIHAGAVLQLVVIGLFLAGCWRTGLKPEPLWNPPTINCAVTAIVGVAALGANHWLVRSSLWYALALQVLFVPWQVWRTVQDPDIAPNCAVSMMQAPCSLNALAFGMVRRGAKIARLGPVFLGDARAEQVLAHALFAAATLVFWITLYCLWARRGPIRERGFDLSFVALTFPSCSTAIAGLQYASPPANAAASGADGTLLLLLRIYTFAVAGCVALTVVVVALGCAKIAVDELRRRAR